MSDLISRADAIEAVGEWMQKEYGYLDLNRAERLIDALSALPSADAVHGEWGHMMIDGNKLMLALSEWWYSSFGLEETEESKAIHKVMDEVERYVDNEKSADYWIPCSERLPEKDELVLVTVWNDVTIAWRNIYGGWESAEDMYEKGDVTAWMPLPKPYREDGEE